MVLGGLLSPQPPADTPHLVVKALRRISSNAFDVPQPVPLLKLEAVPLPLLQEFLPLPDPFLLANNLTRSRSIFTRQGLSASILLLHVFGQSKICKD